MGVFSRWPYSNAHQLNLDWIIAEVKKMTGALDEVTALTQEVRALSKEINSKLDAQDAKIDTRLDSQDTYLAEQVAAMQTAIQNAIDSATSQLETQFETLETSLRSEVINNAQTIINDAIANNKISGTSFMSTTLYSGMVPVDENAFVLSDDPLNYDYILIASGYNATSSHSLDVIEPREFIKGYPEVHIYSVFQDNNDQFTTRLQIGTISIMRDGDYTDNLHYKVNYDRSSTWTWSGSLSEQPVNGMPVGGFISKIIGVRAQITVTP